MVVHLCWKACSVLVVSSGSLFGLVISPNPPPVETADRPGSSEGVFHIFSNFLLKGTPNKFQKNSTVDEQNPAPPLVLVLWKCFVDNKDISANPQAIHPNQWEIHRNP